MFKFFDNEGVLLAGTCVPEAIMLDEDGNELILKNGNTTFENRVVERINSKGQVKTTNYGLYHMAMNYLNPYSVPFRVVYQRLG